MIIPLSTPVDHYYYVITVYTMYTCTMSPAKRCPCSIFMMSYHATFTTHYCETLLLLLLLSSSLGFYTRVIIEAELIEIITLIASRHTFGY